MASTSSSTMSKPLPAGSTATFDFKKEYSASLGVDPNRDIFFHCDVTYSSKLTTSNKPPKNPRHVVVTGCMLHLFKKGALDKSIHHFDLAEINTNTNNKTVTLTYRREWTSGLFSKTKNVSAVVVIGSEHYFQLASILRSVVAELHCFADEPSYLAVQCSDPPPMPDSATDPAHTISAAYRAWCVYRGQPFCLAFERYLQEVLQGPTPSSIDLSACPGVDALCNEVRVDLVCVVLALAFSTKFKEWRFRGLNSRTGANVLVAVGGALSVNRSLTSLVMERCGEQVVDYVAACFPTSSVQILSLDGCHISSAPGAAKLFTALVNTNRPLLSLSLAGCGLSPKQVAALFVALQSADSVTASLQHLKLDHNKLEAAGTASLATWLVVFRDKLPLRSLSLAYTSLDVPGLMPVTASCLGKIEFLDLSGNSLGKDVVVSCNYLLKYVESVQQLRYLSLANTDFPASQLEPFFRTISSNKNLSNVALNLADNNLGFEGATAIARAGLSLSSSVTYLDVSHNSFTTKGAIDVLSGLTHAAAIRSLWISDNISDNKDAPVFCEKLVAFAERLEALGLSAKKKQTKPSTILPFISKLGSLPTLKYIDLSGHQFGDWGAHELAESLRNTGCCLTHVNIDCNKIGPAGWGFLASAMGVNRKLQHMDYSESDVNWGFVSLSTCTHGVLFDAVVKIRQNLESNYATLGCGCFKSPVMFPDPSPPEPNHTAPPKLQRQAAAIPQAAVQQTTTTSTTSDPPAQQQQQQPTATIAVVEDSPFAPVVGEEDNLPPPLPRRPSKTSSSNDTSPDNTVTKDTEEDEENEEDENDAPVPPPLPTD